MAEPRPAVTHLSLKNQGYHTIPIIPPGAPLAPGCNIPSDNCGKVPGRRNTDGYWTGFPGWQKEVPAEAQLQQYTGDGAGIGIVCGKKKGVVAVDIDCMDADTAQWVQELALERLGWAPVRVGQAPKSLLLYRVDLLSAEVSSHTLAFVPQGITQRQLVETRVGGQQFVAYGVHPSTGLEYTWPEGGLEEVCPSDLTPVDADDLAGFFELLAEKLVEAGVEIVQTSSGGGGGSERGLADQDLLKESTEILDEAMAHIPNTDEQFPDRQSYIQMGHAIKAAYADDPDSGYQAWLDWADKWDGVHDRPPEKEWETFRPPFEIGAGYIIDVARANGYKDAARVHEPYEGGEGENEVEFWARYAWVEQFCQFYDLWGRVFLSKLSFSIRYPHAGNGIFTNKNAAAYYLHDTERRTVVKRVTYRPGADQLIHEGEDLVLNMWNPGPIWSGGWDMNKEVNEGDIAPYMKLIDHLYPDDRERGLLLDWLAFQLQCPGVKCSWHPVIGGTQGIGKDSLVEPVIQGIGQDNVESILPSDLQGNFSEWKASTQLLVIQEMNNFARKETMDTIKPLLAAPPHELSVNPKYVEKYHVPNILNCVFFTNHRDAIALENGDRRFFVLWSEAQPLSGTFYTAYYGWLDEGGGAADVCRYLLQRDLSGFNPTAHAPHTQAKDEMRDAALPPLSSVLKEAVESRDGMFENRDLFTWNELEAWAKSNVPWGTKCTNGTISKALEAVKGERLGRFRVDPEQTSTQRSVWAVRNPAAYRSLGVQGAGKEYLEQLSRATKDSGVFNGGNSG